MNYLNKRIRQLNMFTIMVSILSLSVITFSMPLTGESKSAESSLTKKTENAVPCKRKPDTQVVNNSGIPIFKVKVGSIEFSKNLSHCYNGCSTGFKSVASGTNQIAIKLGKTAPWVKIGTLGKFNKCQHYAVNIIRNSNSLCAVLALRHNTNPTYNNDRTKKIITKTCTKLKSRKHGTQENLRAVQNKKTIKAKPRLIKQNQKAVLQFDIPVKNLVIKGQKGKVLQSFKMGKRFDISKSVKQNRGKDLKLIYFNADPLKKNPAKPGNIVPFEGEITRLLSSRMMLRSMLETLRNLDRKEPGNNNINGAVNAITGTLTGEVGGDDPNDYFYIKTSPSGYGTYFKITRTSGNVKLHLYAPGKGYLDWNNNSVWIAVRPNSQFYVQVEPTSSASLTPYQLNVESKAVVDPMEPNDSFSSAKLYNTAGNKVLCNLFTSTGGYVGIKDYYKFTMTEEKLVRINISNAGLQSGRSVSISLYDKNNTHHTTASGSANGGILEFDLRGSYSASWPPFPAGEWRILVTTHSESNARAYGTGNGPGCYTNASGYSLNLELID